MALFLVYALITVVVLVYSFEYLIGCRDDEREPRRLRARTPLVGHLLGIIAHGPSYHSKLKHDHDVEIFTLGILHLKLYTSVSTRLMPLIQRQPQRQLSFLPMLRHVARRWGGASDETDALFARTDLAADLSRAMRTSLAPGPHLDAQNLRMARRALVDVDELLGRVREQEQKGGGYTVKLLEWTRHAAMQASSCGVYGNNHPFLDPEIAAAFWTWHAHLSSHLSGAVNLDSLFRTGYAARQKVFAAHERYCAAVPGDASELLRSRWRVLRAAGVPEADCARQQATLPIGMLSNTVPTLYWTLWELFSRPTLLALVRDELLAAGAVVVVQRPTPQEVDDTGSSSGAGHGEFALHVAALKRRCPLLLSVMQETQRARHVHAAVRKVLRDTELDGGRYLLRGGSYLQMPGYAIHHSTSVWGPSAGEFDPHRFVPREEEAEEEEEGEGGGGGGGGGETTKRRKQRGSDFLVWGAPPHLCPARQFAATEMLILVALLAMRADLAPAEGGGAWEAAPALDLGDPVTVLNPKRDVPVRVMSRPEWEGEWSVVMSESTLRVPLASG
ncbi:Cytochrome P450 [Cordyceps fumosorosea ARSEF 2679]|uniref:Cytochrome P450 n=1 Tax=Cordyceps fumosorosea (strain ARSEF 2679) TaxID=1081104 RepID=A0A167LKP4_CORFA|nr:Cytochrome P450 [Cordyceps fumosorosea ARSEF 2679]OAA53194.1 Cytochrome P450 [Cordyceps fumosorosea ARSEF 2679]